MSESRWRPTASLAALRARAELLRRTRAFFAERAVLEVETAALSAAAVSDPQIESLATTLAGDAREYFLHTSPEYAMKRLLAAGSGDIFQLCKVFRDGERGRWHNPEFTMLEWYRLGFDDQALMSEVEALLAALFAPLPVKPALRLSYAEALRVHAGVDAFTASAAQLDAAARRHEVSCAGELDRDARLDLLMALVVAPRLGFDAPCFICDYPSSQAALARLKPGMDAPVAARFELYMNGVELANGFHELADPQEQRARFTHDLGVRAHRAQRLPPLDENLIAALHAGLPDCAGVAVGFDRLVAVVLGASRLDEVLAFSSSNA